jgi:hypothetical protein
MLGLSVLLPGSASGSSEPKSSSLIVETFSRIECHADFDTVSYAANGIDYAPNQRIDVFLDVIPPNTRAAIPDNEVTLTTSPTGSWSTSLFVEEAGAPVGTWGLYVEVHVAATGGIIDYSSSSCTF